jgi:hypothetical protein
MHSCTVRIASRKHRSKVCNFTCAVVVVGFSQVQHSYEAC